MILTQKYVDQWKIKEIPGINPYSHGQLLFEKGRNILQRRKDSLMKKSVGKPGQPHVNQ